jgi:hypothetical protein
MRPPFDSPIVRIRVPPDEADQDPSAIVGPRPRGSRRPHTDAKVAAVRRLIEQTAQTYGEIAAKTGVGRASICRWTRDGGWKRPAFAPRATDTVPTARASAKLKRRTLAARLHALAERHIRELEDAACVDPDRLAEALELLKMAKVAASPRRGRRWRQTPFVPAQAGTEGLQTPDQPMRPIMQLATAGVHLRRAPRAAIDDFLAHREPPAEKPPRRRRNRRGRLDEHHAWMLEREGG